MIYDFNIQNLVTFEDNLKYKGNIPLCVYADFETTAPADDCQSPENRSMYAVSYCLVFAWHPKLNLKRQIVIRGFNHSLSELTDVSYLTSEQLAFRNQRTAEQFTDSIKNVYAKRKNAIAELFNIELKFACDLLTKWYKYKIKSNNLQVSNIVRIQYKRIHPITAETKCKIYNFLLDVTPKGLEHKENEMSYLDFLIRKEHSFIRNIFDKEELQKSRYLKSHEAMRLYIKLVKVAETEIKNVESYDLIYDNDLQEFLKENCPTYEYDLPGLMNDYVIQLYAFFYQCLIDFPTCKFDELKTITTRNMFEKFYKVIKSKVHLHHSHTTGEIKGNCHDFCNLKIRENKETISLIGHNFLGFDIFYMVNGYNSSCWGTKNINMGGTNLTNVNFANISDQIKIIDTLKYYQTTLANLASTAEDFEKSNIKKILSSLKKIIIILSKFGKS